MFDADPTARLYLPDVGTRNVRALFGAFPRFVHAPSMVKAEVTAAWLQAVRDRKLSWAEYGEYLADFNADLDNDFIRIWRDDDLLPGVLVVQEQVTKLHLEDPQVSLLHTHDAYYVALTRAIAEASEQRTILVTMDARVWRAARALGIEVFHANTCDLGRRQLAVGMPGQPFDDGANCRPCRYASCPSGFVIDLAARPLPQHLGSGTPRSQRERDTQAQRAGLTQP